MKIGTIQTLHKDIPYTSIGNHKGIIPKGTKYIIGFDKNMHLLDSKDKYKTMFVSEEDKNLVDGYDTEGLATYMTDWFKDRFGNEAYEYILEELVALSARDFKYEIEDMLDNLYS